MNYEQMKEEWDRLSEVGFRSFINPGPGGFPKDVSRTWKQYGRWDIWAFFDAAVGIRVGAGSQTMKGQPTMPVSRHGEIVLTAEHARAIAMALLLEGRAEIYAYNDNE